MPWQVYDYLEPSSYTDQYGPLPCKRWIRDGKKHKLSYKWRYPAEDSFARQERNRRQAIAYAQWLARRDGLAIPAQGTPELITSGVYVGRRYEKRVKAVEWRTEERVPQYAPGKRGRRWTHDEVVRNTHLRIDFPNWNWVPADPVEETLPAMAA